MRGVAGWQCETLRTIHNFKRDMEMNLRPAIVDEDHNMAVLYLDWSCIS